MDLDSDPDLKYTYEELRIRVVNDPVGQCLIVELLLRLFVLHILGAQPDAVAQPLGVRAENVNWFSDGVAASLTSLGCLCILQAARGELEASGRGSLHGHWELWALAETMQHAMAKFANLQPKEKLHKLKLVAAQWLNFFQRTHHSSIEHLPKIFGQDRTTDPMIVTKDMIDRCRMDGQVDAYNGYTKQQRPKVTDTPVLELPKRLPPDDFYEPTVHQSAASEESSGNTPVVEPSSADCESATSQTLSQETEVSWPKRRRHSTTRHACTPDSAASASCSSASPGNTSVVEPLSASQTSAQESEVASSGGRRLSASSHASVSDSPSTSQGDTPVVESGSADAESATCQTPAQQSASAVAPPPLPHSVPRQTKKPIRGQALTALPSYRRIQCLRQGSASDRELSAQKWLERFLTDSWQVQARAMLHVCGASCWKYNKTGTKICRHHCYHIVTLKPSADADPRPDKELKIRRDGRPLNNQMYIMEDQSRGKRGRICPIVVCPFETMTAYVAAASLRCNFDNQSLIYLPPASVLPLEWMPNIGDQQQYASMNRDTGDLQPKWLLPEADSDMDTLMDLDKMQHLVKELESELQGAFQDAHNTGFYINEYTTKVHALGDKLFQGMQRIVNKITAEEAAGSVETTTRQRNKERTRAILKKFVFLLNTMQVKSGSELVFPILFDHMSFSTHRCWETNLRLPFAKVLAAWQAEFKGSLLTLHQNASVAKRVGFLLPSMLSGKPNQLPDGWLVVPRGSGDSDSANQTAMREHVEAEQEDDLRHVYISPDGLRFSSLNQALKHCADAGLRKRLDRDVANSAVQDVDNATGMTIQFTSNFEDYMHRGVGGLLEALPLYFYNMWIYSCKKPTRADPLERYMVQQTFDGSYGAPSTIRLQRISLTPRIPQLEGVFIPSPDVNPHLMALIKLILFKPFTASHAVDAKGVPLDPYKLLYQLPQTAHVRKRRKEQINENPYEVLPAAWEAYWRETVLPNAQRADAKIASRKEWPTIWECVEIYEALKGQAMELGLIENDNKVKEKTGFHPAYKLANRLTLQEYVCYMTRRIAGHLDAHGRAKAAPKTKSYAMDSNTVEDPGIIRTPEGGTGDGDFDDMPQPEFDDEVKLKPGDAPLQVYHELNQESRVRALLFHRQRTSKFVREMIDQGMLRIVASEESLAAACKHCTDADVDGMHEPPGLDSHADQLQMKDKLPTINQTLLDAQREAMAADPDPKHQQQQQQQHELRPSPMDADDSRQQQAFWQKFEKPSIAMANKIREFESSSSGFQLSLEQRASCRWFGEAMDATLEDEQQEVPLPDRTQRSCLLIGAGGTGKTTVILMLMLTVFCYFFPGEEGEDRYLITTYSHAQSDAISNETHKATTAHAACSYRVASMRNRDLALRSKEEEMKKRWTCKLLLIQDEISLVPCLVENMMLYRSMRAREDLGVKPEEYASPSCLFGRMPIVLIAGDFMQIRPANELSLGDDLRAIAEKGGNRQVLAEHFGAQGAIMSIKTVIHLKKTNRFQDAELPRITAGMRAARPDKPISEELLDLLRQRRIEKCQRDLASDLFRHGNVLGMYWENIARSMTERAFRDARELDVPLVCLQAADQRHKKRTPALEQQLTHQLLTIPNLHKTGKLQGMLLLHERMVVRLTDVLAPKHSLVKDKLGTVVKIDFHSKDQERLANTGGRFQLFCPKYMALGVWVKILKYNQSPMKKHLLENWRHNDVEITENEEQEAGSMIFVELVHSNFKIDVDLAGETEKVEVIRWQFPLTHGMLRTAFAAQGMTLEGGVVIDLRRAGGLDDSDWWLAIYVMLSRARKLSNMILLGFTPKVEELLRNGPPDNLVKVTERLEAAADETMAGLKEWPAYDNADCGN